jgi:hypothetical protein
LPENGRQGLDEEDGQLLVEKEENLKTLIDECKKMLITEPDECLGGWGLIDCDPETGDPAQQDMDIILLLSQKAFYVARYVKRLGIFVVVSSVSADSASAVFSIFFEFNEHVQVLDS